MTVIRISPMAHFASGFLAIALVAVMPAFGSPGLVLLAIPVLLSFAIERFRTSADDDAVTARGLLSSRTVPWGGVNGLEFTRGGWARACLVTGEKTLLPAVTFASLPTLAAASGGKVPNPYG